MSIAQYDDPGYLEAVYAALFSQLQSATFGGGITLASSLRAAIAPDESPPANQPALIQLQGPMHVEQKDAFSLAKWTFTAVAVLYARVQGAMTAQDPLAVTTANYLIWGIKNCLNTKPPYQKVTLGGLVYHTWIEGVVSTEVSNEQMVITLPIYMLAGTSG